MNYLYLLEETTFDFCSSQDVWSILYYVDIAVTALFVIAPIVLLAIGIVDLVKAVTSQKDEEIKKATNLLIKKVVAGIVVFLMPILISLLLNVIGNNYSKGTTGCENLKKVFSFKIDPQTAVPDISGGTQVPSGSDDGGGHGANESDDGSGV